ncbi:nitrogen regulation protein NtrY [Phaeobacter piscinae]|uniref:histidine kinase n=1 Tax=Phaeobacter piscinae TaxID=1580596 RepID=A0ABN5DHE5_9RHOB|nr:sensor histidine kinase [Phaeobacter piscinae]ATG35468.1 nitrogen regulation protein NtrY [Phaeobacter piscinae]AUQ85988.1 nitrogen regulation protein NtrY [Phaeobacter piscinae]AUR23872.1 nitrogen regulation protein NtrY [Phaeobacter piscinae]
MSDNSAINTEKINSSLASERLEAARFFSQYATKSDLPMLRAALAREKVTWISNALRRSIFRLTPENDNQDNAVESPKKREAAEDLPDQILAEAIETTTKQVLHEIEPLVGALRLAAEAEIENFEESRTFLKLERISMFMGALSRLREAAGSPKLKEFHLDGVISDCIQEVNESLSISLSPNLQPKVSDAGKRPCIAFGDPELLSFAIQNGIRNAVEATIATELEKKPDVLVTWGETEKDFWVSVVDHGVGFSGNTLKAFEMGKTSKRDHLGMGLTISKRAMDSIGGTISLTPRERGVRFEISWPKRL